MAKLTGKIAVITGGNSGIGLATAQVFAAEGAQVVVTGRRQEALDAALKTIGHGAAGIRGDVAKLADLDRLYAEVKKTFGRIDVLFANAGIGRSVPLQDATEEHFDSIFAVNVKGLYFTVQKALPLLSEGASVILTGSAAGVTGMANSSVYSATKAAVRSLARTWAAELVARKIRVNTLSPGPIRTPIIDTLGLTAEQRDAFEKGIVAMVPMGRMGEPEEVAKAALYLASSDSTYVTGVDLFVDGGAAQV